jgi:hypothetical protein
MTKASKIAGLSSIAQQMIVGDSAVNISAAGTTQGTATVITADNNYITTCASGAGVILPSGEISQSTNIFNNGLNSLAVYPPVGGMLGSLPINTPSYIASGQSAEYFYSSALNSSYAGNTPLPATQYTSIASGNGTLSAGNMEGAAFCALLTSGATALTTRTAAQLFAVIPHAVIGISWIVRVINTNGSTLTLTMDASITATGTLTIATNTYRDFIVTFTSATAATMKQIGTGTTS